MSDNTGDAIEREVEAQFGMLLESGYIKYLNIDLLNSRITIKFTRRDSDGVTWHVVEFEGVRAVYYRGGILAWPIPPDRPPQEWETELIEDTVGAIEWYGAQFKRHGVYGIQIDGSNVAWAGTAGATANFSLDIMGGNGALLIEANRVKIDASVFDVGYPDS
jgi:hypothetical protein